jgi:NADPH:quinone reductase-like Zn-dependent oxidoreductase
MSAAREVTLQYQAVQYDSYRGIDGMKLGLASLNAPDSRPVVRIEAAALNPKDLLVAKGKFKLLSGWRFPKFPGLDFAGTVERAGGGFEVGARVFGTLDQWRQQRGTLAQRVAPFLDEVARIPKGVAAADAAAVSLVGLTALQALRDVARIRPGASVLIHGASGGLGTVAIQVAHLLGAEVTTVSSAPTEALCADLGAAHTLAYEALPGALASGKFDVLFDVFGNLPFPRARGALKRRGLYVGTVPTPRLLSRDLVSRFSDQQERMVIVKPRRRDIEQLGAWLGSGALRAVIAARYPLARFREAFTQLATRHTHGKLVIDLDADERDASTR